MPWREPADDSADDALVPADDSVATGIISQEMYDAVVAEVADEEADENPLKDFVVKLDNDSYDEYVVRCAIVRIEPLPVEAWEGLSLVPLYS